MYHISLLFYVNCNTTVLVCLQNMNVFKFNSSRIVVPLWESWIMTDNCKLGLKLALGVGSSRFSKILHLKFKERWKWE